MLKALVLSFLVSLFSGAVQAEVYKCESQTTSALTIKVDVLNEKAELINGSDTSILNLTQSGKQESEGKVGMIYIYEGKDINNPYLNLTVVYYELSQLAILVGHQSGEQYRFNCKVDLLSYR